MKVTTQSSQFLTFRAFQYSQTNSSSGWEGDQVQLSTEARDLSNHRYHQPEMQEQLQRPEPDQKWCPAAPSSFGDVMGRFFESLFGGDLRGAFEGLFGSLFGNPRGCPQHGGGPVSGSLPFEPASGPAAAPAPSQPAAPAPSLPAEIASGPSQPGGAMSDRVMDRAHQVGDQINADGGYVFDGQNDCYGMVRRTWDPILQEMGMDALPVADGPNSENWGRIEDWSQLRPGDVLSTSQGHQWGDTWHGGLYAGMDENGNHLIYDNSSSQGGASLRALPRDDFFTHFYRPTHDLLTA